MKTKRNIELFGVDKAWKSFVMGDNSMLDIVYQKYHSKLLFTAFYYLKDDEDSLDAVNDIFVKLLEMNSEERFDKLSQVNEKLDTFLKVLVKNKCIDKIRIDKNRKSILNGISSYFNRSNKSHTMIKEDFRQMMSLLPDQQKKILNLHLDGYDNETISNELSISYNTVRNTLSTSKKKIRVLWNTFMS